MIHQYKMNGYNIIIDGNSGSVHSVDDLAYDLISIYEKNSKENKQRNSYNTKKLEDKFNKVN